MPRRKRVNATAEERREAARRIVSGSLGDEMNPLQRVLLPHDAVRLNVPLSDYAETLGVLRLYLRELERIIFNAEKMAHDPNGAARLVHGEIRALDQKAMAKRRRGRKRT
jgi:hypothetical protein